VVPDVRRRLGEQGHGSRVLAACDVGLGGHGSHAYRAVDGHDAVEFLDRPQVDKMLET